VLRFAAGLVSGPEFVESERTRTQVGALVQTALVADNFAGVECRPPPGRRLSGVAIEAAAPEILGLLRRGIIGVLNRMARNGCVECGGRRHLERRRRRSVVGWRGLGGHHDRRLLRIVVRIRAGMHVRRIRLLVPVLAHIRESRASDHVVFWPGVLLLPALSAVVRVLLLVQILEKRG
jgi:hypothetical protein